MNPTRRRMKRRSEIQKAKSQAGVLARERNRMLRAEECGVWSRVATLVLVVSAAPDGRSVGIWACGGAGSWQRCGSERAVRGALAKILWGKKTKNCLLNGPGMRPEKGWAS